jgi:hypothetical protein
MGRLRALLFVCLIVGGIFGRDTVSRAQLIDSLSVSLTGGSVSFPLTRGSATNTGVGTLSARTQWSLVLLRSHIDLDAYFSSASAALAHQSVANTADIPSSRVEVSVNGGPMQPFNQTVHFGAPNAGRRLFTQPLTLFNLIGQRDVALTFNINLSGHALPADTYSGVLHLRARAEP